jgi:hypothetical protein
MIDGCKPSLLANRGTKKKISMVTPSANTRAKSEEREDARQPLE